MSQPVGPPPSFTSRLIGGQAGLSALVFAVFGIGMLGWGGGEFWDGLRLDRQGVTVQGMVTAKSRHSTRTQHGGRQSRNVVRYRFTAGDGAVLDGEQVVSAQFYARVTARRASPVRYLPGAPAVSEVEPGRMLKAGSVYALGGLAFLIAAAACGAAAWRGARR